MSFKEAQRHGGERGGTGDPASLPAMPRQARGKGDGEQKKSLRVLFNRAKQSLVEKGIASLALAMTV